MCDLCVFVAMLKDDARKLRSRNPFNWKKFWVGVLIFVVFLAIGYGICIWMIK